MEFGVVHPNEKDSLTIPGLSGINSTQLEQVATVVKDAVCLGKQ